MPYCYLCEMARVEHDGEPCDECHSTLKVCNHCKRRVLHDDDACCAASLHCSCGECASLLPVCRSCRASIDRPPPDEDEEEELVHEFIHHDVCDHCHKHRCARCLREKKLHGAIGTLCMACLRATRAMPALLPPPVADLCLAYSDRIYEPVMVCANDMSYP